MVRVGSRLTGGSFVYFFHIGKVRPARRLEGSQTVVGAAQESQIGTGPISDLKPGLPVGKRSSISPNRASALLPNCSSVTLRPRQKACGSYLSGLRSSCGNGNPSLSSISAVNQRTIPPSNPRSLVSGCGNSALSGAKTRELLTGFLRID